MTMHGPSPFLSHSLDLSVHYCSVTLTVSLAHFFSLFAKVSCTLIIHDGTYTGLSGGRSYDPAPLLAL
jgi:hypothetical protein